MSDETTTTTPPSATPIKPGYRTTEYWLAKLAIILGALMTAGVFADGSTAARIAGAAVIALGSLGYSVSRGLAKQAGFGALELILVLAVAACLFTASALVLGGCSPSSRARVARATHGVVDCMKPDAKAAIGEFKDVTVQAIKNATGDDGKVDTAQVKGSIRSFKKDIGGCVLAAAVTELLSPAPANPDAPQSAALEIDRASLRGGFDELRAELYGGARFQLEGGTL